MTYTSKHWDRSGFTSHTVWTGVIKYRDIEREEKEKVHLFHMMVTINGDVDSVVYVKDWHLLTCRASKDILSIWSIEIFFFFKCLIINMNKTGC